MRVHATGVNPIEWKMRRSMGLPAWAWRRAIGKRMVLGLDFAGIVAAVGLNAGNFRVGDEVMGAMPLAGTYAEYLLVRPSNRRVAIAKKPPNISFEAAGVVPFAGLVAYAGLVTDGQLPAQASHAHVLIIGASGAWGTWPNADFVRSLGADEVIRP